MEKSIMKTVCIRSLVLVTVAALIVFPGMTTAGQAPPPQKAPAPQSSGASPSQSQEAWPREVKSGDTTFKVHQPQLESWDGTKVSAYSAIEVRGAGRDTPTYGAALLTART